MESTPASPNWADIPQWSLQVGSLGKTLIAIAVVAFLVSGLLSAFSDRWPRIRQIALFLGGFSIFGATGALLQLILNKQYQFHYVFKHSDNTLDFGYRFASLWGGQEGSFLLWAVMTSVFIMIVQPFTGKYQRAFTAAGALLLAGLAGILAYESPFNLIPPDQLPTALLGKVPPDGAGLSAALINYWMQIHPPTIFLGFGSLAALYAWSIAALVTGDLKSWLRPVRPLALVSLSIIGLGVCMGGFWAYETLGWGGFWMWDPVENASVVPWFLVAGFIHAIYVAQQRGKWLVATTLFGGFGFVGFCYGTFLTRSGFLGDTSVHSFASMDRTALWLLTGVAGLSLLSLLGLAAWRGAKLNASEQRTIDTVSGWNLNRFFGMAITLLTAMAVACAIGMSVPLIMSLQGKPPKVVEEVFYNRTMAYLFVPTVLLMGLGPYLSWRGLRPGEVFNRLAYAFALTIGTLGGGMLLLRSIPAEKSVPMSQITAFTPSFGLPTVVWTLFLAGICLFGIFANLVRMFEDRKRILDRSGAYITHAGVILTVLGLLVSRGLQKKQQFDVQGGRPTLALGYVINVAGMDSSLMERENKIHFELENNKEKLLAKPTLFYTENPNGGEPQATVRPYIFHRPMHDLYVSLFPMVTEATGKETMAKGQTKGFEQYAIKYEGMTNEGQPGTPGAKFIANLTFTDGEGHVTRVAPALQLAEGGMDRIPAQVGNDYFVFLESVDAASQSATIQLHYVNPIFPMELYYKPLPGLVWWGTGIMTLGGILAAWQRRVRRTPTEPASSESVAETEVEPETRKAPEHEVARVS